MAIRTLVDITLIVNNDTIAYSSNSLSFMDGIGEGTSNSAVVGASGSQKIYSRDLSTRVGKVNFSLPSTADNIALVRAWKVNQDNNVVELIGSSGSNFSKIFTNASIDNEPEVNIEVDGVIEIEFSSNPAQ